MSIEAVRGMLLWSTIINFAFLAVWGLVFVLARDWLHRTHGRWAGLPAETYDAVTFAGIVLYKLGILLFNFVPYIALRIVA